MQKAMKSRAKNAARPLKRTVVWRKKPKGAVWDTEDWINKSMFHRPSRRYFKTCHQSETLRLSRAKGLDEPVHEDFRELEMISRPSYAAVVKNGRVWGNNGFAFTPDHRLLADVSLEFSWEFIIQKKHSVFRRWKAYPLKKTASTVGLLTHTSGENYFHWLFDVLPRMELLRRSGRTIDQYIFRGRAMPFHDETLQMLGIPPEKRIYTHKHFYLQAKRLVIPSLNGHFTWTPDRFASYPIPVSYSKWAFDFIRQELMIKPNLEGSGGSERIYISRAHAAQRRLLNEEQIVAKLVPLGFTVVHPEVMSVKDQIRAFASAKCIVAPHGAGLANLAFCPPGTKVIELFAPIYTPGYFRMLSNHFGLDYYYLIGTRYKIPDHAKWVGGAHFHVGPVRLSRLLELAGID